jgi:hypothetical protein
MLQMSVAKLKAENTYLTAIALPFCGKLSWRLSAIPGGLKA